MIDLEEDDPHWHMKDIKFDLHKKSLQPRPGEVVIDRLKHVEDTKGNNGVEGTFTATNLRFIWVADPRPNINISIGLKCLVSTGSRSTVSRLRGESESLYLTARLKDTQFEFVFTNLVVDSPRLLASARAVHRAFESSKMYREVKVRGALLDGKSLKLLPLEQLYEKVNGVMNLSSDHGTLGTMYISNVRVVWHANTNSMFNFSMPYLQMKTVNIRDSKFGLCMVIESLKNMEHNKNGYVLGFRIDPVERLKATVKEIQNLYQVFSFHPIYGVQYELESEETKDQPLVPEQEEEGEDEDGEIVSMERGDAIAAYFADANKPQDREPVFCAELGLAIEKLPDGLSLKDLWEVT